MLLRHSSMQKIRHCCQNLNLLPYLFYSFDNSRSRLLARRVHVYLRRFFHEILVIGVLATYENLRQPVLRGFCAQKPALESARAETAEASEDLAKPSSRFGRIVKPKRKPNPSYLIAAVYLVPLLLLFQVTILCSLTTLGKRYNPGFIFLFSAVLILGGIALKILLHGTVMYGVGKCEKKKVQ